MQAYDEAFFAMWKQQKWKENYQKINRGAYELYTK